jgi:hypothetical protein
MRVLATSNRKPLLRLQLSATPCMEPSEHRIHHFRNTFRTTCGSRGRALRRLRASKGVHPESFGKGRGSR